MPTTTEPAARRRFFPAAPSAQQDPGRVVEMEITLQPLAALEAAPPSPPPPPAEEPA